MAGKKIMKASLLFAKADLDAILSDLIALEIMDIDEPTIPTDDAILSTSLKTELIDIKHLDTNFETITVLSTESTYYLTGWIWVKSEPQLREMASKYTCAWEVIEPTSAELEKAPIMLIRPGFLFSSYKGPRKLFSPLHKYDD